MFWSSFFPPEWNSGPHQHPIWVRHVVSHVMLVSLRFGEWAFVTLRSWTVTSSNKGDFGERGGEDTPPEKPQSPEKNKVAIIYDHYYFILTLSASIFNSGSSLFSVPAGIKLHYSEEARLSFLTATVLRHSQHSLLFPPFTWAAAAVSAAAGAAAVSLPVLHPGLADLRLTRLHIAKEEERWSHIFFSWFWKQRVVLCGGFGVFFVFWEGERRHVHLGWGGWKLKEIWCKVIQCSTRASAARIQPLLLQRINMGKATEPQSGFTSALCWRWINKVLVVSAC